MRILNSIVKSSVIAMFLFAVSNSAFAGTPPGSFILVNNAGVTDIAPYQAAILQADLESFRYQNRRCIIAFDNGVQFELFSATEVLATGHGIEIGNYKTTDAPAYTMPVFHLNENGTLSAVYSKPGVKQNSLLITN